MVSNQKPWEIPAIYAALQGATPEAQQLMVTHLGRCRQTWSGGKPRSQGKVELSASPQMPDEGRRGTARAG